MKAGKAEWSALSHSLECGTIDDGGSDLVWKSLRHDLERTGISTYVVDKHRALITTKFEEVLDSGVLEAPDQLKREAETMASSPEEPRSEEAHDGDSDQADKTLGQSPECQFFAAAQSGNVGRIVTLLHEGHDPNLEDQDGNTSLHLAAARGDRKSVV